MSNSSVEDYMKKRDALIKREETKSIGWNVKLNDKEKLVNTIVMQLKNQELDDGIANPENCLVSNHFFKCRKRIQQSKIFKIIQKLPKGASLHAHDTALASQEYVYSLTLRDNLYFCEDNDKFRLKFFYPKSVPDKWESVAERRKSDSKFDTFLRSKLTLVVGNPKQNYQNDCDVWNAFIGNFIAVQDLIGYKPIWEEYFYQSLKELYEDNVRYLEFRGVLPEIYDLDGKTYGPIEVVGMYHNTLKRFTTDYPDFYGARFIYAPHRGADSDQMDSYVNILEQIKSAYPNFVAGFDLVGQENLGNPLVAFIPQLLKLKEKGTKFFFHAGETNWQGCSVDSNLFDAILLNTQRIGHGLAIVKHPELLDLIKKNSIAIEVCPISNQVLNLIPDLRNHPGSILIANDCPVVIAQDDPSFWGAKALSYDWYMAFVGLSSRCDDLRFLKQLALNSLEYSSMTECEKRTSRMQWECSWDKFIDEMINTYCCNGT